MSEQLHVDDFPELSRQRLLGIGRVHRFEETQSVFREGEISSELYIIESGSVDIGVAGANGKRLSLNIVGRGCVLGEVAMLDGKGRTAEAVAISTSKIRVLTKEQVFKSFDSAEQAASFFNQQLCKRIRWINQHSERSRLLPASAVVASRLLMTHAISEKGWLKINQETLAQQSGLTREYISQILSGWSAQGIIEKRRGEIRVVEPAALHRLNSEC